MAASLRLRIRVLGPLPGLGYCLQSGKGANAANGPIVTTTGDDLAFDLEVKAAPTRDGATANVTGPYAQGKPGERFLYLCVFVNDQRGEAVPAGRVKVPVFAIPWSLASEAIDADRAVEAGFAGRRGDRPALASVVLDPDWHLA